MTENTKGLKKHKKKSTVVRIFIVLGLILTFVVLGLGVLYVTDCVRIRKQFGSNIWINDHRMAGKTPEQAAEEFHKEITSHVIHLKENEEEIWKGTLEDAGYFVEQKKLTASLEKLLSKQKANLPFLKEKQEFRVPLNIQLKEEKFQQAISGTVIGGERQEPVNAYVEFDSDKQEFVIIPEVKGTLISDTDLQNYVKKELEKSFEEQEYSEKIYITLDDSCYVQPEVTTLDESLNEELNTLNGELERYRNTSVTYLFGDTKEVITGEMICSWLKVENKEVILEEEPVKQFISDLAAKYNTMYRDRYFTTTAGEKIKLEHNEYGYLINTEEEFKKVYQELQSGEKIEREPVYTKTGYQRQGEDDLAGSYIEVSLDQQHLWLYKDGKLITETDIVSGMPTEKRETFRGIWPIHLKASPYKLSSQEYGYSVEVQYWMPFVYGQGLHDAGWRNSFGGEIYKTDGSHGCINLPPQQAKIIYETIAKGYPIVLY